MTENAERLAVEAVIDYGRRLNADGLAIGPAGNISVRIGSRVVISPSQIPYESVEPGQVCQVELDGRQLAGDAVPSSELGMHLAIYAATDAQAVVHTHSPRAVALSTVYDVVPAVHYCVLRLGGPDVRVAPYRRFGSSELAAVAVEIARVGARRDVVLDEVLTGVGMHELPLDADTAGVDWPASRTVVVDPQWRSGYYEVVLRTRGEHAELHRAFVVVRPDPTRKQRVLLVLATNTWNAYNDVAGRNLYTGATQVSYRRPMAPGFLHKPPGFGRRVAATHGVDPARAAHSGYKLVNGLSDWCGSAGWPDWEQPFVAWAEEAGYEFDVAANADLQTRPGLLDGYHLMLSVGHDEYWSAPMRAAVESFVAGGGNVAFFSGNTSFWQVRIEDDDETMIGFKDQFELDPLYGTERERETTTMWSDLIIADPENRMTGLSFTTGGYARIGRRVPAGSTGYTVHRPKHWLLESTGLEYGDLLGAGPGIVAYECDGCRFTYVDGLPYPTGEDQTPEGFTIVATSPVQHFDRESASRPVQEWELEHMAWRAVGSKEPEALARLAHGHAVLGTYTRGGTVVSVGSTDWAHGLRERDRQVVRITANVIERLG